MFKPPKPTNFEYLDREAPRTKRIIDAVLRDAMTKPPSQGELLLWISDLQVGRRQRSLRFLR